MLKRHGKDRFILNVKELKILGTHNYENVMASVAIALCAGIDIDSIIEVVKKFPGVEHRIEFVRELDGISYYNDSKGTNPDAAIKAELIDILLTGGVNRISLGLQSCDDQILKQIGRRHTFDQARQAIRLLQQAGLTNISCDLIYSLPGQTREQWTATLQGVLSLNIPHCSLYSLTIEEHSEFGRTGQQPLDEDTEASMYFEAVQVLKQAGYQHYEISNFAFAGYASRHNLHYWRYNDFYGVGLGASGKLGAFRYDNTRNFQDYFQGRWIAEKIELTREDQMFEMVMMNLRTAAGLSLIEFERIFQTPVTSVYSEAIQNGLRQGWLHLDEEHLAATDSGMALLNTVLEEFLD